MPEGNAVGTSPADYAVNKFIAAGVGHLDALSGNLPESDLNMIRAILEANPEDEEAMMMSFRISELVSWGKSWREMRHEQEVEETEE